MTCLSPPKKHPMAGRPTKYNKDFHPDNFIELSREGKTFAQIAYEWGINRDTIKEWKKVHPEFSAAVRLGRELAEAWYMNLGQDAMLGKAQAQFTYYSWLTKNMFKWSDKHEEIHPPQERPLKDLTDEELDKL